MVSAKSRSEIRKKILQKEQEIYDLEEEYRTALYISEMPEVSPLYKYCYSEANRSIACSEHSVVSWLRAVAKHMALRRPGHGGAYNNVMIIPIPEKVSEQYIIKWADYQREKLVKAAMKHKKRALK